MDIIEIIKVILIGIVQGITEWLPISSTGHMILLDEFIKLDITDEFKKMFFVVIQLGSILAVLILYFNKLNPLSKSKTLNQKKDIFNLWIKVIIGVIPAGVIGVLFDDKINDLFYNYITVAISLIVYGVLFIIIENKNKSRHMKISSLNDLSYKSALMIGLFQVLSLIPGTSRSGSTILGAILIGSSRFVATEFSFFLAIPIMFGASILKFLKFGFIFTTSEIIILATGMITAFLVSILAISFLIKYIKRKDFKVFGYYRIVLGFIVLISFLIL
ncbi:MAG: undecaprenyl-diphosphate phosphatase [Oscillospiraceae bacterium]